MRRPWVLDTIPRRAAPLSRRTISAAPGTGTTWSCHSETKVAPSSSHCSSDRSRPEDEAKAAAASGIANSRHESIVFASRPADAASHRVRKSSWVMTAPHPCTRS